MKTFPKPWPDNIEVFRIGKWRVDHLNQEMMTTMRKIADKRGSTIEEVMDCMLLDFIDRCAAESELETKVIPFPIKRGPNPNSSSDYREQHDFLPPGEVRGDRAIPKGSTGKSNVLALIEESRKLRDSLCFKTEKLANLI